MKKQINQVSTIVKPFLYSVAETIYNRVGENIRNYAFVFPNRRAGIFFGKYLGDIAGKPIFSPSIYTISDFFESISQYTLIDRVELLFIIYTHYKRLSKTQERFDDFIYWGDILANDFNDIDKYMTDASALFSNIKELKEIDVKFGLPLTEEQMKFINRFCDNFKDSGLSDKTRNFITVWNILYELYSAVKNDLRARGKAYEGMIMREVAETAANEDLNLEYAGVIFVGFNLLTPAEEALMKSLKMSGKGDFYWDANSPALKDPYNKAAVFLSDNIKKFPSRYKCDEEPIISYPEIKIIGVPSNTGQTKCAEEILSRLAVSGKPHETGINTAVILPDERLLLPVLYSIPDQYADINVTMGYPLSETPLSGFFQLLFDMQKRVRTDTEDNVSFYYKNIIAILSSPYIRRKFGKSTGDFENEIKTGNKVYVKKTEIPQEFQYIFERVTNVTGAIEYLKRIITSLTGNSTEEECSVSPLEKEFLYQYDTNINKLCPLCSDEIMNPDTFFRLLQKISVGTKVAFKGEPLSGLQIMGVLETRGLDFENIIILTVNEGIFPAGKPTETFIPYNLRMGFGLSVSEHRDSITAYYFYRLIARAKRVFLIYDTRAEGLRTGEVSRFAYQLKYQYLHKCPSLLKEKELSYKIYPGDSNTIKINKTDGIYEKILSFARGGEQALSASALNTYIDCPLKFYLSYIERLEEDEEVLEDLDAASYGTIYHSIMHDLYKRLKGKVVTRDILTTLKKDDALLTRLIEKGFAETYFKSNKPKRLTGRLYLRGEIIRKMVKRTLEIDADRTPFLYVDTELKIKGSISLAPDREVNLKGFIDRVDKCGETTNIIDYKSGNAELRFDSVESLFDPDDARRNKAVFQLFFYALLYLQKEPEAICPGIYSLKKYYDTDFVWRISCEKEPLTDLAGAQRALLDKYAALLKECISEIFDGQKPFVQTENKGICEYCQFRTLCRR